MSKDLKEFLTKLKELLSEYNMEILPNSDSNDDHGPWLEQPWLEIEQYELLQGRRRYNTVLDRIDELTAGEIERYINSLSD